MVADKSLVPLLGNRQMSLRTRRLDSSDSETRKENVKLDHDDEEEEEEEDEEYVPPAREESPYEEEGGRRSHNNSGSSSRRVRVRMTLRRTIGGSGSRDSSGRRDGEGGGISPRATRSKKGSSSFLSPVVNNVKVPNGDREETETEPDTDSDNDQGYQPPESSSRALDDNSNGDDDDDDDDDEVEDRSEAEDGEEDGDGRRRSMRKKTVVFPSYREQDLQESSWVAGGGGSVKGYKRFQFQGTRFSERLSGSRSRRSDVQSDFDGGANQSDDMYSCLKRRRSGRSSKSKKSQERTNDEPVSRRLRDRNKLMNSRSLNDVNSFEGEDKLHNILRNNYHKKKRKRRHSSDSSSSSSSDSDNKFRSPSKKRIKFMTGGKGKPDNVLAHTLIAKKEFKMLMEVQPIAVDPNITFKSIGGLDNFIDKLKEIVLFPLLYNEFYEQRGMSAPKGILLHGPPGTGKTLLARALSNECSNINGKKVSFFLRKGADLLNKFVGESERQLRMLFQQAALHQPSIIFFDEIDGLAPVRSAKSEQIHNSIVSSLLAEIDGLQERGQIIVMGSTNRLDFVDPALRRPGRFDCELPIFLPTRDGRHEILKVHTVKWKESLSDDLLNHLADRSIGFNGADLKFLCWHASMNSLRRAYPQIYSSSQKYLLDYSAIKLEDADWEEAFQDITPSTQRSLFSTYSPAQPLPPFMQPLLSSNVTVAIQHIEHVFPHESVRLLSEPSIKRCLITTDAESGLNSFIIPAILHAMEKVPVFVLSYEALHMDGEQLEFSLTQKCAEIMRQPKPCICYLPDFERLSELFSDACKEIMIRMMAQSVKKPILFLGTVEGGVAQQSSYGHCEMKELFEDHILQLTSPKSQEIKEFFRPVFRQALVVKRKEEKEVLPELPLAPPESPKKPTLSEEELRAVEKHETTTFRELRIFLRQTLTKLARNKKFEEFTQPVDTKEVPDYLEIIQQPMDFEVMMHKVNRGDYFSAKEFLEDISLIYKNCLDYNPARTESDKRLRLRAMELQDFAEKLIDDEMDSDFEEECHRLIKAKKERISATSSHNEESEAVSICSDSLETDDNSVPNGSTVTAKKPAPAIQHTATPSSASVPRSPSKRRRSAWNKGIITKPKPKRKLDGKFGIREDRTNRTVVTTRTNDLPSEVHLSRSRESPIESEPTIATPEDGSNAEMEVEECSSPSPQPHSSTARVKSSTNNSTLELEQTSRGLRNNEETIDKLFKRTLQLCHEKMYNVVQLVDLRFQILRLISKYQFSKNKEDLFIELKELLKKKSTTHLNDLLHRSPKNTASSLLSQSSSIQNQKVKVPASSAPLRFKSLESNYKKRSI